MTGSKTEISTVQVHLIPCTISYDGEAAIDEYFLPKPIKASSENQLSYLKLDAKVELKEVHFRGRRLIGYPVAFSRDYEGVILKKQNECWEKEASFDGFNVFEHDYPPNPQENPFLLAQDWLDISSVLHAHTPIDDI